MPEQLPEQASRVQVGIPSLVLIISLSIGGTWAISQLMQTSRQEQAACIADVEQSVTSNTRRIESLERTQERMAEVPEQIASMSSDLRYLRRSVERLMPGLEKGRRNGGDDG